MYYLIPLLTFCIMLALLHKQLFRSFFVLYPCLICLCSLSLKAQPSINNDASIRWSDMQYQAKPDGSLMYIVTQSGLLIENSLLFIEDSKGAQLANLLPWEMRQQVSSKALSFSEPVRLGTFEGHYRSEVALAGERNLEFQIDFNVPNHRILRQTLQLPHQEFIEKVFYVDGKEYYFSKPNQNQRREVLVSRRPFISFKANSSASNGFEIVPDSSTSLEIEVLSSLDWKQHRSYWINLFCKNGNRVHYTMHLPQKIDDSAANTSLDKHNRLRNGSFELGREEWGVVFNKRDVSSTWSLVDGEATDGAHALCVEIKPQVAAYETHYKTATIASDYFEAKPLERLTISADLKAARKGQKIKMQLRYVPTALVPNRGSNLIQKVITLSDDWKRYSFEASLPLAAKNAYAVAFEIVGTTGSATVFLDAVAVRSHGIADYLSQAPVESHSDTLRYHRLYEPGEPFDVQTFLRNEQQEKTIQTVRLTIRDAAGSVLHRQLRESVPVAAKSNYLINWKLPNFYKQGMYRIGIEVGASIDTLRDSHGLSLAVLRGRDVSAVNPNNRFGVNITDLREFWALERIGIGWSRFTFDCGLGQLMRKRGVWDQVHADKLDALLDYQASFGVTPLAVLGPGMPKWASRAPHGSSASRAYTYRDDVDSYFEDYLTRLLDMADGRLYAIETWNEPDIPLFYRGTIEEMASFTARAHDIIKAHSPQIDVVGLGLATPAETHNKFLKRLLKKSGLDPYDAISYHPYTEGRRHPARGDFREVVQSIRDVISEFGEVPPLWATEFGYFGYAHDAKPFVPFKNPFVAREILDESESASAYIQAICTAFANGVDKTFYFTLLEGNLLDRWLQGWVGPGGRSVESGFIAAATACDLIQDVDCIGQEQIRKNLWQTRFLSDSKQFVVLWSEGAEQVINLRDLSEVNGYDVFGNPLHFKSINQSIALPLSMTPIYLNIADLREFL